MKMGRLGWGSKKEIVGIWMLALLMDGQMHGYEILQRLNADPFLGPVNPGVVYRILRELEFSGLVASQWDVGGGPARRVYSITPYGRQYLKNIKPFLEEHKKFIETVLKKLENSK